MKERAVSCLFAAMLAVSAPLAVSGAGEGSYPVLPHVTRLDGTVFHGNDANRAIITNAYFQLNHPAAKPAPATIDVLLVYDKNSADTVMNAGESLREHGAKAVAKMNSLLIPTDMDTNFWFRLVGVYKVGVSSTVEASFGQAKNGAPGWEHVNEVRERVGADIVLTVANAGGVAGLAWRLSPEEIRSGAGAAHAYAGVALGYWNTFAWVHEVGHMTSLYHSMGEARDRYDNGGYVGCGFGGKIAADGTELGSIMGGSYATGVCFSSPNHICHGTEVSVRNDNGDWLDSTGVMNSLMPYVANYKETKLPEGIVLSVTPQDNATVAADAQMTVSCNDPDAELFYSQNVTGDEELEPYAGPVEITPWHPLLGAAAYKIVAKKGGEVVATQTRNYQKVGLLVTETPADILDSQDFVWSKGNSWQTTEDFSPKNGSAYRLALGAGISDVLVATATLSQSMNLVFHHIDAFADASLVVWVDDMPMFELAGTCSSSGAWVEDHIRLDKGYHEIVFEFTQESARDGSCIYLDDVSLKTADYVWAGDAGGNGVWATSGAFTPWKGELSFANGATVTFPDTGASASRVLVKGTVEPSRAIFSAKTTAYVFDAMPEDAAAQGTDATQGEGHDIIDEETVEEEYAPPLVVIEEGQNLTFATNATLNVPFSLPSGMEYVVASAERSRLELNSVFGSVSGDSIGYFAGGVRVSKYSTVVVAPGEGRVQYVGDFGKNWSYTDSTLVVGAGKVVACGAINGDSGLLQHKAVRVADGGVLEFTVEDATGRGMASSNDKIVVGQGGEVKFGASDRLRRALSLEGGTVTVAGGKTLALYNGPAVSVSADSALAGEGSLAISGANANIALGARTTLSNALPIAAANAEGLAISGSGTFSQAAGKGISVGSLSLESSATLCLALDGDADPSTPLVRCANAATLAGLVKVVAPFDLAAGEYAVLAAPSLNLAKTPMAPALGRRCALEVDGGTLYLKVSDEEKTTASTPFGVKYLWLADRYPELVGEPDLTFEMFSLHSVAANGRDKVWQSYVLGLDPTDETSVFSLSIKMDGAVPVVGYSPTNETLAASGAIRYVLQGRPTLTNDWADCESFATPGDANRFFRVKVTW